MNFNRPEICPYCHNYSAPQVDVSLHQRFDPSRTMIVSKEEIQRLYNLEIAYENQIQQRRDELWNLDLKRFEQEELIKRLEDTINQYQRKIQQLEMIIDMLNLRIQGLNRNYNRLLVKHTTLNKPYYYNDNSIYID